MRITKFGHACVRIEHDGKALVIDPGMFTDREAVDGVDAVLITHEHMDHLHLENLHATSAPVFTIDAVAAQLDDAVRERTTVVAPGDSFEAAGLAVEAVGELHAVIHPELQRFYNSGYLVSGDQTLFHPGDSFTPPGRDIDVLCLPVSAPWCKISEVMDYARLVTAATTLAIHELVYSEFGLGMADQRVQSMVGDNRYARLAPGEDL